MSTNCILCTRYIFQYEVWCIVWHFEDPNCLFPTYSQHLWSITLLYCRIHRQLTCVMLPIMYNLKSNFKCCTHVIHLLIRWRLYGPGVSAARLVEGTVINVGTQGCPSHSVLWHLYKTPPNNSHVGKTFHICHFNWLYYKDALWY